MGGKGPAIKIKNFKFKKKINFEEEENVLTAIKQKEGWAAPEGLHGTAGPLKNKTKKMRLPLITYV